MDPPKNVLLGDFSKSLYFVKKEFDEEGAAFGQLEIDITLDFALTHSDPTKPNRIGVYFTDAPQDPSKAEVLFAEIDPTTHKGRIRGTINYPADRTVSWVHFMLNDDEVSCAVQNINELVGPGAKLTIAKTVSSISELQPTLPKSFLSYSQGDEFYMAGIGLNYFGFRYYDPEIGIFTSADPADYYWNSYSYCGGNIVNLIDPDGLAPVDNPDVDYMANLLVLYQISPETYDAIMSDPTVITPGILEMNILALTPNASYNGGISGDAGGFFLNYLGAMSDMRRNYQDMREANTIGADKYFHSKANFEAASRGWGGYYAAQDISNLREIGDQRIKGDPRWASIQDQVANHVGRKGALLGVRAYQVFRPNGLDSKY